MSKKEFIARFIRFFCIIIFIIMLCKNENNSEKQNIIYIFCFGLACIVSEFIGYYKITKNEVKFYELCVFKSIN